MDVTLYVGHVLPDLLIFDRLPTAFTPRFTITTPSIIEDNNNKNPDNDVPPAPHLTSPPRSDHTPLRASA
jgi:hypothetical protein